MATLDLQGKTALVTGATSGIGLETAAGLAGEHMHALACLVQRRALEEAVDHDTR